MRLRLDSKNVMIKFKFISHANIVTEKALVYLNEKQKGAWQ